MTGAVAAMADDVGEDDVLSQLAASAARFAAASAGDDDIWAGIAGQGWLLAALGEPHGGFGVGIAGVTTVARELGRAGLRQPLAAIAAGTVTCLEAVADRTPWRERLMSVTDGRVLATIAWQDERGGLGGPGVEVRTTDAGLTLHGVARFVAAPDSAAFIVHAGDRLVWVERDAPGLAIRHEICPDGSVLAAVILAGVAITPEDHLAAGADARRILRRATDATLIACAAELLGVMDGALTMTLEYLRTRRQFGVPIGSFQTLQHRAVDMWIQRELTDAAVQNAVAIFDDGSSDDDQRSAAASGAKARASEAAVTLCNQALQLHGAIGFAAEYGLGKLLNRALTLSAWSGNAAQHRARFAAFATFEGVAA